jgi:chaperone modulatory protein CbpM
MMNTGEFLRRSHVDMSTLEAWIEAEWLLPVSSGKTFNFSDADLARALLIDDLKIDFGVNDEGIAIVLHLIDQLHGLRCLVRDIQTMAASDRASDGR